MCEKKIQIEEAASFAEIFEVITTDETALPYWTEHGPTKVQSYCSCRYGSFKKLYVKPRADVLDTLLKSLIVTDDVMNWEIVVRDNREILITLNHNKILGNRWVALFAPTDLPPKDEFIDWLIKQV
jgi:hypothetical protein